MLTTLTIALIGAGGAILGGLLNGAYQHLLDWLNRPVLHIDYAGSDANLVSAEYKKGDINVAEIYVRARVTNTGRTIAKGCRVFLVALKEVHASGTTATSWHDSTSLAWAGHDFIPRNVPRDVRFYVDVLKISKHSPGWSFPVERFFASQANLKTYRGRYRFGLMVTGENAAARHM